MKHRRTALHGLVILNALLLAALAWTTFTPRAEAQARRSGPYMIVGGTVNGQPNGVAYIIDETNQEMIAITWNEANRVLSGLGYANLAADAARAQASRP